MSKLLIWQFWNSPKIQIFANLNQQKINSTLMISNCRLKGSLLRFSTKFWSNIYLKHCGSSPAQNLRSSGKGLNLIVTKTRRDEGCLNHLGTRYDTIWVKIESIFQPIFKSVILGKSKRWITFSFKSHSCKWKTFSWKSQTYLATYQINAV